MTGHRFLTPSRVRSPAPQHSLLGDNCMSIKDNLKNVNWDSILVYGQCFDPDKSSKIVNCDSDPIKYYGSQKYWAPILDVMGKVCQLMIDVAPEPQ